MTVPASQITGVIGSATLPVANLTGSTAVANGGTGQPTLAANGVVYGQGTSGVGVTTIGAVGQVLVGTGGAPAWSGTATFTGVVAVGTTTPQATLHVRKDVPAALGPTLLIENGGGTANAEARLDMATYDPLGNSPNVRISVRDSGNFGANVDVQTKATGAIGNALASRLFIRSDGNVGIGATSPGSKLTVAGVIESAPGGGFKFPDRSVQTTAAGGTVPGTFTWQVVAGATQQAQSNTGYVANNAGLVTITLPSAPGVGDTVRVSGAGTGGWQIAQNAGQSITGNFLGLGIGEVWVGRGPGSRLGWRQIASSADGAKLAAGDGFGQIYTSVALSHQHHTRKLVKMGIASQQVRAVFDGRGIDYRIRGRELVLAMQVGGVQCDARIQHGDHALLRVSDDLIRFILAGFPA